MHILNSMKDHRSDYARTTDNPKLYSTCRKTFVNQSQKTVSEGLARQNLPDQPVYVVSRDVLRHTYNSALHPHCKLSDWTQPDAEVIHERLLVKEVLTAAAERRCETDGLSVAQVCTRTTMPQLHGQTHGYKPRLCQYFVC